MKFGNVLLLAGLLAAVGTISAGAQTLYIGGQSASVMAYTSSGVGSVYYNSTSNRVYPFGMDFGSDGTLYISNFADNTVGKLTSSGVYSVMATGIGSPQDLAVDKSGNVYVASYSSNSIYKITASGQVSAFASGLSNPQGLAIDPSGNLYVVNVGNGTLDKITPAGVLSVVASSGLYSARDVVIDSHGNLFVATNAGNNGYLSELLKVTPGGQVSYFANFGLYGTTEAIDIDSSDTIWGVSQTGIISKVSTTGVVTTVGNYAGAANSIAVVPEPEIYGLLIMGICLLLWRAKWQTRCWA